MTSLRTVISVSALLAVVAFVAMMVFAPVRSREPGGGTPFSATVQDQGVRIQRALAEGRMIAATSLAQRVASDFPESPEAWLWKAQVAQVAGDVSKARDAGRRLVELLNTSQSQETMAGAAWSYRMGWALFALGRGEEARAHFRAAAESYETGSIGAVRESIRRYNLACYRAMAGDLDEAAAQFALAVDANYGRDVGWWRVDPDLGPIREHRVFQDSAIVLTKREEERAERARQAREQRDAGVGQSPDGSGGPSGTGQAGGVEADGRVEEGGRPGP